MAIDGWASRETRPAKRETLEYAAMPVATIGEILADTDLQQCMAVAARRAQLSDLSPQPPGPSGRFPGTRVR